jgi:RNA-directed DNA polymerase
LSERELERFELDYVQAVRTKLGVAVPDEVANRAAAYAGTLIRRGVPVLFDQVHLSVVTGVRSQTIGTIRRHPERFYSSFRIPKKSGGSRLVQAPSPDLKRIQHWIQQQITGNLKPHPASHGFVRGRTIITKAQAHVRADVILKLDIRDFFGSVRRQSVYRTFRFLGYSSTVANLLADLVSLDDALPQGAPTSPDLANMAAYRLDVRLNAFARKRRMTYTRYADDLTFSGRFTPLEQRTIEHIMRSEGFAPNEKKLHYLLPDNRQLVTGVVVNEKLNWPRLRRRWLRQEVYYLRRFGLDDHFRARGISRSRYKEYIYGHAYALRAHNTDEADKLLAELDQVDWTY